MANKHSKNWRGEYQKGVGGGEGRGEGEGGGGGEFC